MRPEIAVTFRVMGKELNPEDVSKLLGFDPDMGHSKGDPRHGREGRRYSDFSEGLWSYSSPLGNRASLHDHLNAVLARLKTVGPALEELRSQGFRLDILVGAFGIDTQFAFSVTNETAKDIADLGLSLDFDLYTN